MSKATLKRRTSASFRDAAGLAGLVLLGAAGCALIIGNVTGDKTVDDTASLPAPTIVASPGHVSHSGQTIVASVATKAPVMDELRPGTSVLADLRLGINETDGIDQLTVAIQDAEARIDSLVSRHDRLTRTLGDLIEGGISLDITDGDLAPENTRTTAVGKPQVIDETERAHPLAVIARTVRGELAAAKREAPDQAAARIEAANKQLDAVAIRQFGVLDQVERVVEGKRDRMASVPRALGITVPSRQSTEAGVGGPLVPLSGTQAAAYAFETRIEAVELTLANLTDIGNIITRLPIRRPVATNSRMSSRFGARRDPFTRRPAMHQGLDFRAPRGAKVFAAGAGKVIAAGRRGGYGKIVEIDHGQGLTSRYAHLSRINVAIGDTVVPGDVIGRVGSTGRSTGPHLHFEVRRNGTARNPAPYLRAGRKI